MSQAGMEPMTEKQIGATWSNLEQINEITQPGEQEPLSARPKSSLYYYSTVVRS